MTYMFEGKEIAAARLGKLHELFVTATEPFLRKRQFGKLKTVVDLGCGVGHTTRALSTMLDANEFFGLDNSEFFIEQAVDLSRDFPRISYRVHNVLETPFPAERADVIYLRFLLTHLPDPRAHIQSWSAQLAPGGVILLEETESIRTTEPVFQEYLDISDEMLRSNNNILYIGKMLEAWEYGDNLRKRHNGIAKVAVTTPKAAEMFFMNIQSWKDREFIKKNYLDDVRRIESQLKELTNSDDGETTIEWDIRQMALANV